jgi:hypothetical protein
MGNSVLIRNSELLYSTGDFVRRGERSRSVGDEHSTWSPCSHLLALS